jgi:hypothetical protein
MKIIEKVYSDSFRSRYYEKIVVNNKNYTRINNSDNSIKWYAGDIDSEFLLYTDLSNELEIGYNNLKRKNKLNNILNENY